MGDDLPDSFAHKLTQHEGESESRTTPQWRGLLQENLDNSRASRSIASCDSPTRRKARDSISPAVALTRTKSFSYSKAARNSGVENGATRDERNELSAPRRSLRCSSLLPASVIYPHSKLSRRIGHSVQSAALTGAQIMRRTGKPRIPRPALSQQRK